MFRLYSRYFVPPSSTSNRSRPQPPCCSQSQVALEPSPPRLSSLPLQHSPPTLTMGLDRNLCPLPPTSRSQDSTLAPTTTARTRRTAREAMREPRSTLALEAIGEERKERRRRGGVCWGLRTFFCSALRGRWRGGNVDGMRRSGSAVNPTVVFVYVVLNSTSTECLRIQRSRLQYVAAALIRPANATTGTARSFRGRCFVWGTSAVSHAAVPAPTDSFRVFRHVFRHAAKT